MNFKPLPCRSRWESLFVAFWLILINILLLIWLTHRAVDWISFVLALAILLTLLVFAHLLYRIWGTFTLEYWFDRNALHVNWAATHVTIPLVSIRRIIEGEEAVSAWNPLYWPSPYVRSVRKGRRQIEQYATRPLSASLVIETKGGTIFAISPQRRDFFLEALQAYNHLGAIQSVKLQENHPLRQNLARIGGAGGWLLIAGLVGVLLLFGVLMIYYPTLPDRLIFHYNSDGLPDSIRAKNALFLLPIIGALTFLVNSVAGFWMSYRQQRVGAYLLWGGTITVHVLALLALFSLII